MRGIVVVLVAVVALAGCAGGAEESALEAGEPADAGGAPDADRAAGEGVAAADDGAGSPGQGDGGGGGGSADGDALLTAAAVDRIVRDGTVQLEVGGDGFDRAFDRLLALADRVGGTVVSSDVTTSDDGATAGTVTLRVPAEEFDQALVAVGRLGEIRHRSVTSEDVSQESVDLEARLRHNQAQERFYLSLLDRADDVDDAIAVQQQVDRIQETIERIEGRLRFLDERTSYSRLTVDVVEAGATLQAGGPSPSLAAYWETARDALITVVGGSLVVATATLPIVVLALLAWWLWRRADLLRRRATAPEA